MIRKKSSARKSTRRPQRSKTDQQGKITKAVKNLRFNDSMLRAYSNVEAVTQKRGVAGRNWGGIGSITAPSVLIRDFRFTGTTEF